MKSPTPALVPVLLLVVMTLVACRSGPGTGRRVAIEDEPFGSTSDGQAVELYVLTSPSGATAKVMTYGATLTELWVPDRDGELADVVLGFDDVAGYEGDGNQYFGCTVGRVANRIARGRFSLEGETYELAVNNEPNHLHGGVRGLNGVVWDVVGTDVTDDGASIELSYASPDGEEGYPGRLEVRVKYTLTNEDEVRIDYRATTDAPTPVNLTHHSYFNLAGAGAESVLDHELEIAAGHYTPTDDTLIPTGRIAPVRGTLVDFTSSRRIGDRVQALDASAALGYDHNYVLDRRGEGLELAARVHEPVSGRVMEVWTTEPGLQFYTGNFLFGQEGKGGRTYAHRSALCLEAQHFPDSINQPTFPSIVLVPGETYEQTTAYRFTAQ